MLSKLKTMDKCCYHQAQKKQSVPLISLKTIGRQDQLQKAVHQLMLKVRGSESMLDDWQRGIIYLTHKKGEITQCSNYGGIMLLSAIYKIFSAILLGRIAPYAHNIICPYQIGFTPGKSATDQVFSVRQAMGKLFEYGQQLYHLFIDFKAAYDSIARVKLYTAMREFGIPTKLTD